MTEPTEWAVREAMALTSVGYQSRVVRDIALALDAKGEAMSDESNQTKTNVRGYYKKNGVYCPPYFRGPPSPLMQPKQNLRPGVDEETLPLVTCGRCTSDFLILDCFTRTTKKQRCHCGRVFWIPESKEKFGGIGPQCMTPADYRRWKEGY